MTWFQLVLSNLFRTGTYAMGPRAIAHRYTVGPEGCRMLFICAPAGFERMVRDMSVPAQRRTLPPAADEEPDREQVAAVASANGCELDRRHGSVPSHPKPVDSEEPVT